VQGLAVADETESKTQDTELDIGLAIAARRQRHSAASESDVVQSDGKGETVQASTHIYR